jgi:enamine deaminase RidA (YjgF/YER057c/UK114 family)
VTPCHDWIRATVTLVMSTAAIPTIEPATFVAGDSLSWTKYLADYIPSDGWSLTYSFRGNGSTLNITSTTSGTSHLLALTTTQTGKLIPGKYSVSGYAVSGSQRVTIFSGQIEVTANLQTASASFDPRSQNRRTLDNINAVLEGRASSTVLDSTVEGTNLRRIPHADLLQLQAIYQVKVRNEEIKLLQAQGLPTGRTIFATFTKPK